MVISPCFLPDEFYVRVMASRAGYYDQIELPYFAGYRHNSYIQYNKQKQHFRTIKRFGKKIKILDGKD